MEQHNIIIKFNKDIIQARDNQTLILKYIAIQDNFLTQFTYRSIVTDEMLTPQNSINTINFENLGAICYVQNTDNMSLEEKERLAQKMNAYNFVEYSYVEKLIPMELLHSPQINNEEALISKTDHDTPNFIHLQGYKDGITPTHIGIDMEYGWSIAIAGQGMRCADIETGFNFEHINLQRDSFVNLVPYKKVDHGTSVAGIMYANDVGFGVKGMVHNMDAFYGISQVPYGRVGGIAKGLSNLKTGDVFVYEMQTGGLTGKYVPADFDYAVWDATQEALEAGIIVIGAAGDGDEDLDLDVYFEYRNRPDNGIIRVGAGDELLSKKDFSTYGSMIHVQGWGGNVVTTGGGSLYDGGVNNNYTNDFNGTSSATAIVASAAVAIQSWYKQQTGKVLTSHKMRSLLIETGIPQSHTDLAPFKHIGPIPNVRNAINELRKHLKPSEVKVVIDGPVQVKSNEAVILSAEKSTSNVADITAYDWQLPDGITAEIRDESILRFSAPKVTQSQDFSITLTVTDALGNSASASYTLTVTADTATNYPLWDRTQIYWGGNRVSWENKNWRAEWWSLNDEPGKPYNGSNSGPNPWKEIVQSY